MSSGGPAPEERQDGEEGRAWTVARLLRAAAGYLLERGVERNRLEAEVLLGSVLGLGRLDLLLRHDMPATDEDRARYRELVRRRGAGEPTAYLTGEREFHSLTFAVDRRCLIPRPETEHLVDWALARLESRPAGEGPPRVLDVGTGSGCIVLALAARFPEAVYVATDVSEDALAVARRNRERLAPAVPVTFHAGDLLEPSASEAPFDLILANPPYVRSAEMAELPREVREHEPALALCSGDDAIAFHRRLVREGLPRLRPGGALAMELSEDGYFPLAAWLGDEEPAARIAAVLDHRGVRRIAVVERREPGG